MARSVSAGRDGWQFSEQRVRFSKPRPFPPPDVIGHRRLLAENALGPFSCVRDAASVGEEARVVVLHFGQRRQLRHLGEERVRLLALAEVTQLSTLSEV